MCWIRQKKCVTVFVILHQGQVRAQGTLADLQAVFGDASASLNDIYLALTKEG